MTGRTPRRQSPVRSRRGAASLALLGLVLQLVLSTVHAARHFDHLVGPLGTSSKAVEHAGTPAPDPVSPTQDNPAPAGFDGCPIGLALAAAGNVVLAAPDLFPRSLSFDLAQLETAPAATRSTARRHSLPPARAPPAIEIFA